MDPNLKLTGDQINRIIKETTSFLSFSVGDSAKVQKDQKRKRINCTEVFLTDNPDKPEGFEAEVEALLKFIKRDTEEVKAKHAEICENIAATLSPAFSYFKTYPFQTGLELKNEELEICLSGLVQEVTETHIQLLIALFSKSRKFSGFKTQDIDECMCIRCRHTKTGIYCCVRLQKKSFVAINELVKYYVKLDRKIEPLMVLIRVWGERWVTLTLDYNFPKFGWEFLVIFFLQQKPYETPTVQDFWWGKKYRNQILRKESLPNLLRGFFQFYANFDYFTQLISVYNGRSVKKSSCLKSTTSSIGLCLQDPFNQSRNLAQACDHITSYLVIASEKASEDVLLPDSDLVRELLTRNLNDEFDNFKFRIIKTTSGCTDDEWLDLIKIVTLETVKDILLCTAHVMTETDSTYCISCQGDIDIWPGRHVVEKDLHSRSKIEIETLISAAVKDRNTQKYPIQFGMELIFCRDPCQIEIVIRNCNKINNLHVGYLRIKIPQFLSDAVNSIEADLRGDEPEEVPDEFFEDFFTEDLTEGIRFFEAMELEPMVVNSGSSRESSPGRYGIQVVEDDLPTHSRAGSLSKQNERNSPRKRDRALRKRKKKEKKATKKKLYNKILGILSKTAVENEESKDEMDSRVETEENKMPLSEILTKIAKDEKEKEDELLRKEEELKKNQKQLQRRKNKAFHRSKHAIDIMTDSGDKFTLVKTFKQLPKKKIPHQSPLATNSPIHFDFNTLPRKDSKIDKYGMGVKQIFNALGLRGENLKFLEDCEHNTQVVCRYCHKPVDKNRSKEASHRKQGVEIAIQTDP